MGRFAIPSGIRDATDALNGLDDLITAKEWTRAAVVYAFTYDARGNPTERGKARSSVKDFAARGIHGLTNEHTVAAYRTAWKQAIADGHADEVHPGDTVALPTVPWPGRTDKGGQRRYTEQAPGSFARALKNGAVDIDAFAQDLDKATAEAIVARVAEQRPAVIAEVVANTPDAARAIGRNEAATEQVESHAVHRRAAADLPEPAEAGRQAAHRTNQALGGGDLCTDQLNFAARSIMQGMILVNEFGCRDGDAEAEAIGRIKRALRAYEANKLPADLTDADAEWARANGIEVQA